MEIFSSWDDVIFFFSFFLMIFKTKKSRYKALAAYEHIFCSSQWHFHSMAVHKHILTSIKSNDFVPNWHGCVISKWVWNNSRFDKNYSRYHHNAQLPKSTICGVHTHGSHTHTLHTKYTQDTHIGRSKTTILSHRVPIFHCILRKQEIQITPVEEFSIWTKNP